MSESVVSLQIKNQVAEVVIRRPESLNALDSQVLSRLSEIFDELDQTVRGANGYQQARVVTIRGEGDRALAAGADIKFMRSASRQALSEFISLGQRLMRQIELLPLPVIAVIQGFAIGGGLELALACDLIVGTEKAKVGQAEVNLGLIPGFGGSQRLIHRVGIGAAKRLTYTGESINGEEAQRVGLFDWYVPSTELEAALTQICATLCSKGPIAIAAAKRCIERTVEQGKLAGLTREAEEFVQLFSTRDTVEGLAAFVGKRKAQFVGS